ncbi:COMM domain-containing protein 10 [Chamberlinius hualienensis]
MTTIIASSDNIKKGLSIINRLNSAKFPLILTRIIKSLHNKNEKSFSETEEVKLQASLGLSAEDVNLLLSTLHYIFEQAVFHLAKPSLLSQQLLELGTDEKKVEDIIEAWTNNAKSLVEKLSQRSIAPEELEDVSWRLHVKMSNSKKLKEATPVALFEFNVKDNCTQTNSPFVAEFTHDELSSFYNQLEAIQNRLDSLR